MKKIDFSWNRKRKATNYTTPSEKYVQDLKCLFIWRFSILSQRTTQLIGQGAALCPTETNISAFDYRHNCSVIQCALILFHYLSQYTAPTEKCSCILIRIRYYKNIRFYLDALDAMLLFGEFLWFRVFGGFFRCILFCSREKYCSSCKVHTQYPESISATAQLSVSIQTFYQSSVFSLELFCLEEFSST